MTSSGDALRVRVTRLDAGLALPTRAHEDDAGVDLLAAQDADLAPGERMLMPTGLAVAIPAGYVGLVHPRSGLAARHGITVLNAPGTIDAGYRGEIRVNVINLDPENSFTISRGDRVAQLLVQRVERVEWDEVPPEDWREDTPRGATGHGDSGGFGRRPARVSGTVPAGARGADNGRHDKD